MLIDVSTLPELLQGHMDALRGIVTNALNDFMEHHRTLRARYTARTEASIIHDYMVWHATDAGFPRRLKRNLFLFRVGNDYAVKPKKLDQQLRPRNIPTQLMLRFDSQRAMHLFDDLDLTHLYLGYQRDGAELLTSSVWLVCPDGRRGVKWAAELRSGEANGNVEVAVPVTPTIPTESTGGRVKPKIAAVEKKVAASEDE